MGIPGTDTVERYKDYAARHGQSAEGNPSGGNFYRGLYNITLKSLGAALKKPREVCLGRGRLGGAPQGCSGVLGAWTRPQSIHFFLGGLPPKSKEFPLLFFGESISRAVQEHPKLHRWKVEEFDPPSPILVGGVFPEEGIFWVKMKLARVGGGHWRWPWG